MPLLVRRTAMDIVIDTDGRDRAITEADLYRSPEFLRHETDRGCVLTLAAITERLLGTLVALLAAKGKPKVVQGLLGGVGPFVGVGARIDWLAAIGVLNEPLRRDLHRIETLRLRCATEWATFAIDGRVETEVTDELWARRAITEWTPGFLATGLRRFWNARERFEYFVACEIAVLNKLVGGELGRAKRRRRRYAVNVQLRDGGTLSAARPMDEVECALFELALNEAVRFALPFRVCESLALPPGGVASATVERARKRVGTQRLPATAAGEESRATLLLMRRPSAPSDALEPRNGAHRDA